MIQNKGVFSNTNDPKAVVIISTLVHNINKDDFVLQNIDMDKLLMTTPKRPACKKIPNENANRNGPYIIKPLVQIEFTMSNTDVCYNRESLLFCEVQLKYLLLA